MIKTLIEVTCSEKNKAVPFTGIVVGRITKIDLMPEFLGVHYQYEKVDGTVLLANESYAPKILTKDETNAFFTLIEPLLPSTVNWYTDRFNEFYEAFKVEMASTFGIETSDIENI